MSRVAKNPIAIPKGVDVEVNVGTVSVKGGKGELTMVLHPAVEIHEQDGVLRFAAKAGAKGAGALAGTTRALVNNMVVGVSRGFERRLQLVGVGYRAQAEMGQVKLTLGFSHPVEYRLPDGVSAETPSQTELVLKAADKKLLGKVAADIRSFRPPEPYKGKGIRYSDEKIHRKEAKKK